MREKILSVIQQHGPMLPIEIGSKIGADSFLAGAFLSELVKTGKVIESKESVGLSKIYYLSGQEEAVKKKLSEISSQKKTARMYSQGDVNVTPELMKKQKEFEEIAKKVEYEEEHVRKKPEKPVVEKKELAPIQIAKKIVQKIVPKQVVEQPPQKKYVPSVPTWQTSQNEIAKPQVIFPREPIKSVATIAVKRRRATIPADPHFIDRAMQYLAERRVEIVEKTIKSKINAELIIRVPSALGGVNFFVKIRSKKKVSRADLSVVYAEAIDKKLPVIYLTNGELTPTAQKYLKTMSGLLRVERL